MNFFLTLFLTMHVLHASTPSQLIEIEDELAEYQKCIFPSLPPERYKSPNTSPSVSPTNCDEVIEEKFKLVPIQPDFAEPMASAYGCPLTMKYYGKGQTTDVHEVRKRFLKQAQQHNSEQEPTSYSWGIITHKGVSGVVFSYPSKSSSPTKKVLEVARILVPAAQGQGLGRNILDTVFEHLPDAAWRAKSDPQNTASWKSRQNAGFTHVETKFDKQDRAIRRFDQRLSNNEIEGRITVYFPYSNKTVSLASLELEYTERCLRENQNSADKSRTHFLPIKDASSKEKMRKSISPVGVDELVHEEVSQRNAQKKEQKQKKKDPLKIKLEF